MEEGERLAGARGARRSSSLTPAVIDPVEPVSADALLAAQPPLQERPGALDEIRERIAARDGRLLVIDDDPTGTQSVHGVPVLTAWSEDDLAAALRDAGTVFVLTNSRSQPEREAVAVNREITGRAAAIAAAEGYALAVASRSDSTMRGHFPQEPDAVADALGTTVDGVLLCPCFLEAGRLTIDDVQWVAEDDRLVPSARTTYATDRSFGYEASNLRRWVEEKTGGAVPAADVLSLGLQDIREGGPERVREILAAAERSPPRGGQRHRLRGPRARLCSGCSTPRPTGSPSSTAAVPRSSGRAAASRRRRRSRRGALRAPRAAAGHGLVVVGSHVARTTQQLDARARARRRARRRAVRRAAARRRGARAEIARRWRRSSAACPSAR